MWGLFDAAGKAVRGLVYDVTEYETTSTYRSSSIEKAIEILDNVPGMTPCRTSLFKHSYFKFSLQDGSQVRTWTNRAVGGDHVFLADPDGKMLYGGFVWVHADELKDAINLIRSKLT
ncbi:hypothetical protein [Spirulina subsalsa]|uniref:hypothetical protein n=1 Tax=Spirulina subsalsa TaxID=54311 RepID=UPI00036539E8|nr:hypothetical protein [Spirulina subsalsa]